MIPIRLLQAPSNHPLFGGKPKCNPSLANNYMVITRFRDKIVDQVTIILQLFFYHFQQNLTVKPLVP